MNLKNSKIFSYIMAAIFLIIAISQAVSGYYAALFPFVCALIFFYRGFKQQ